MTTRAQRINARHSKIWAEADKLKTRTRFNASSRLKPGDRVQLHPATDHWMRGDRYGTVSRILITGRIRILLDKSKKYVTVDQANIYEVID